MGSGGTAMRLETLAVLGMPRPSDTVDQKFISETKPVHSID